MAEYQTLNKVVVTRGKKAVDVPAGTNDFEFTEAEAKELLAAGALIEVAERVDPPKPASKPATKPKQGDDDLGLGDK